MTNYAAVERLLVEALDLKRRPIAIAFQNSPPPGVQKFSGTVPSSCTFWKLAAAGRTFYTVPSDHYNCPVGSYVHSVPLPEGRQQELNDILALYTDMGYLRMGEVPGIPRVAGTPGAIVYAPLADIPVEPDAVIVAGPPGRMMLLQEAATRRGVKPQPLLGRPTCMAIPAVAIQPIASSVGCIGNRIYTELSENDLYVTVAGKELEGITRELGTIVKANAALTTHHLARRASLTS